MGDEGLEHSSETCDIGSFDSSAAHALHSDFPELVELLELFPQLSRRTQQRCRRRVKRIVLETRELLGAARV